MALDKATLKDDLVAIFSDPKTSSNVEQVAEAMANAFEKFVKTGKAVGTDTRGDGHNLNIE